MLLGGMRFRIGGEEVRRNSDGLCSWVFVSESIWYGI